MKIRRRKQTSIEVSGKVGPHKRGLTVSGSILSSSVIVQKTSFRRITSFDIFCLSIERATNLIRIHELVHGKRSAPPKNLSDTHRAAIVLTISALDAFIRTFLIAEIRTLLADRKIALPEPLLAQIKKYVNQDALIDAARKDDLLERVEKAFEADFEQRSFQGVRNITDGMKMLGYSDIFHEVAIKAGMNEDTLRKEIDKYTNRRHVIAHKGDYDLSQSPPVENVVTKKDAEDCIKLVKKIAKHINDMRKGQ